MQVTIKQWLLLSGLVLSGAGLALAIKLKNKASKKYWDYQKSPILNLSDVINQKNKKDLIVTAQIISAPTITYSKKVYANQKYYCEPSDIPVIQQISPTFKSLTMPSKIADLNQGSECQKLVPNFGNIISDIYTVQRKFTQKNLGFFGKIHYYISYFFQFFSDILEKKEVVAENQRRTPAFSGPCIGVMAYTIGLACNIPIVFSCKIDDYGNVIPEITAVSKKNILQYFLAYKVGSQLLCIGLGVLSLILARHSLQILKKILKRYFFSSKNNRLQVYNPDEAQNSPSCIVCMDKPRNTVIFDCKHLIVCRECVDQLTKCPICKENINETKLIYSK